MSHHHDKDITHAPIEGEVPPPQYGNDKEKDLDAINKNATVDVASERSLTFGSMLKGEAASRLTVFERKAALINA